MSCRVVLQPVLHFFGHQKHRLRLHNVSLSCFTCGNWFLRKPAPVLKGRLNWRSLQVSRRDFCGPDIEPAALQPAISAWCSLGIVINYQSFRIFRSHNLVPGMCVFPHIKIGLQHVLDLHNNFHRLLLHIFGTIIGSCCLTAMHVVGEFIVEGCFISISHVQESV